MHLRAVISTLFSITLLSACNPTTTPADAFALADAFAPADAGRAADDAFTAVDAPVSVDAPSASGTNIAMSYAMQTGTFDRAFMGYVRTGGTITGLYFELSRGADDACPSATSPTPQQIITVDGFSSAMPAAQTDGLMVRFFDFEGLFRTEVAPDMPTMARVEVTALDITAGTAQGNVMFTFARGTAAGSFRATHCDSLDAM
jgi:hypothetical protein